nr:sugar ABC transporter substrate-binding protein [Conexibacter arvalis]
MTGDISDFGQGQVNGLRSVAEANGGSLTIFDGGFDAQRQNADCQDVVTTGKYNGIVMNGNSGPAAVACVTAAREAGIPIVALETAIGPDPEKLEPQVEGVVGSVLIPASSTAEGQIELLREACEQLRADPCNYLLIIGDRSYQLDDTRMKVFEEQLGGDAGYKRLGLGEDGYDGAVGQRVVNDLLRAQPNTDVIVASTDSTAVQAAKVVKDLGREGRVLITGDGGSREGVKGIAAGDVFSTQALLPVQMGEIAAQMIVDAVNGRAIERDAVSVYDLTEPRVLKQDNVDAFTPEWG